MTLRHREKIEELYKRIRFPEAIDWWASCYAMDELDVMISNARHLDPIRKEIENEVWRRIVPSGGLVLDLACGRGFFSWRVHKALEGKARIIGVDLSETILRAAHDQYRHIDFVIGDAEQMPFKSDIFTNVLVISSLEHMENPRHAIKEIYRVLKPGGSLVKETPEICKMRWYERNLR
jgi:ubiquinone/menaquinone biosynthesis C-methylase UbiE